MTGRSWGGLIVVGCLVGCTNGTAPPSGTAQLQVSAAGQVTLREGFAGELQQWEPCEGTWEQRASPNSGVLVQTATDRDFPLALWKRQRWGDVDVTVRLRPVSGKVDASGGIAFRARDGRNYYVVRANSLEDNFRLYTVVDGKRSNIASTRIDPPTLGEWHTLRVVAVGPRIQAWLNDRLLIDHRDETFQSGYVGLWTKADAVTEFDDLAVTGGASE